MISPFKEARCTDGHSLSPLANRIAFATLEARPSALDFEQSPVCQPMANKIINSNLFVQVLQDWVTATDIRIVFNRLSADQAELYGLEGEEEAKRVRREKFDENSGNGTLPSNSMLELMNGDEEIGERGGGLNLDRIRERYFYALAELAVGGRCKCNGHASRCIIDRMGR